MHACPAISEDGNYAQMTMMSWDCRSVHHAAAAGVRRWECKSRKKAAVHTVKRMLRADSVVRVHSNPQHMFPAFVSPNVLDLLDCLFQTDSSAVSLLLMHTNEAQ